MVAENIKSSRARSHCSYGIEGLGLAGAAVEVAGRLSGESARLGVSREATGLGAGDVDLGGRGVGVDAFTGAEPDEDEVEVDASG